MHLDFFKKIRKDARAGFTLIELLIYMGLFSILLTVFIQLFGVIFEAQTENEAVTSVASDAKFIMGRFAYDMNRATSIYSPTSLGSSSASLTLVINSQNYTYALDNGNLMLQSSLSSLSGQLNSNEASVSAVSFTRFDGGDKDVVRMTFTLVSDARKGISKEIKTYDISAGLR